MTPAAVCLPSPITPDGRYIIVRGRLWRACRPDLSAGRRQKLIDALMDGRRLLRGQRAPEERAEARRAVDEAKQALGERGPVWWTDGAPDYNRRLARNTPYAAWYASVVSPDENGSDFRQSVRDKAIEDTVLGLLHQRPDGSTICPSEVARAIHVEASHWRAAMPEITDVAGRLADRGLLRVTRNGEAVNANSRGGPIRLGRGPAFKNKQDAS